MDSVMKKTISVLVLALVAVALSPAADAALRGHWKLDVRDVPAAGQTPDEVGEHPGNYEVRTGTVGDFSPSLYGGPFPPGINGNALYGDGTVTSPHVRVPYVADANSIALEGHDFTLAFFIMFATNPSPAGWEMIMHASYSSSSGGPNTWNMMYWDNANGTRHLFIYCDAGQRHLGDYAFVTGQWYHVAITRSGGTVTSYIDGAQLATVTGPVVTYNDATMDLFIGANHHYYVNGNGWPWLAGALDDVRIYDNALTEAEIGAIIVTNQATNPDPSDGETDVDPDAVTTWDAPSIPNYNFDVYFDTAPIDGSSVPVSTAQTAASYDPSPSGALDFATTYYWRVDTRDLDSLDPNGIPEVWAGPVWSFTTAMQAAVNPVPSDGATDVPHDQILGWNNYSVGSENDVYFGTDETAVTNADRTDVTGIYKGQYAATTYDPFGAGDMDALTTYFWRVDIVTVGGTVLAVGDVWDFTTTDVLCDPPLAGDINGDCIVDILDFAELASDWLGCNLSPQTLCP